MRSNARAIDADEVIVAMGSGTARSGVRIGIAGAIGGSAKAAFSKLGRARLGQDDRRAILWQVRARTLVSLREWCCSAWWCRGRRNGLSYEQDEDHDACLQNPSCELAAHRTNRHVRPIHSLVPLLAGAQRHQQLDLIKFRTWLGAVHAAVGLAWSNSPITRMECNPHAGPLPVALRPQWGRLMDQESVQQFTGPRLATWSGQGQRSPGSCAQ